jgi:hypothetical protein
MKAYQFYIGGFVIVTAVALTAPLLFQRQSYVSQRTESCLDQRRSAVLNRRAWTTSSCEAEFDHQVCLLVASGYPGRGYHPDCP